MKQQGMSIATQDLAKVLISRMEIEMHSKGSMTDEIEYQINTFRYKMLKDHAEKLKIKQ